jgi:hypothetical protein
VSRFLSANNEAASTRSSVRIFVACDLDFTSGHLYAHDGIGSMLWGGNEYLGLGQFGGIDLEEESIEVIARPVRLTLSGVDPPLLLSALDGDDPYQGRPATLYFGLCDNDTNQLIDTPEILWDGVMDRMEVGLWKGRGEIVLSCEHRLRTAPRIARYTHEDEQIAYPGDRFFDLMPTIAGYVGKWGARDQIIGRVVGIKPGSVIRP